MSCEEDSHSHNKLETLNYQQLQKKYRALKGQFNEEKLQNLNLVRRNSVLNQKITMSIRFIEVIPSSDIPRLKVLLQVCLKKGMGMRSIIGRIEDAINKTYTPKKYGDVDWDKALLVLRIGSPRLLHALHITDCLPVVSTIQNTQLQSTNKIRRHK